MGFQSTHPVRGATSFLLGTLWYRYEFQSTHPVRGATNAADMTRIAYEFQSTHPVRGATVTSATSFPSCECFNPRTP